MTPQSTMSVPIERSIPPVMMTNVVPRARMPVTVAAVRIEVRLFAVKKGELAKREHDDHDDARRREQLLHRAAPPGQPKSAHVDRGIGRR